MTPTIHASAFRGISGSDHRLRLRALLLASTLLIAAPALAPAQELPSGGKVASGNVTINSPGANSMVIRQGSDRAVVNWNSFSIGNGASVTIRQPGTNSAILNRVTGNATSQIHGSLSANGQAYIVNPNGIVIGKSGKVNTGGGFVASTLDISDQDFNAGRLSFGGKGASAGVTNMGAISVGRGGYAALIGGRVNNAGTITAPLGRIGLGAGERVTLDLSGDGFLMVAMPSEDDGDDSALIKNSGRVSADGGRIEMKAATARNAARHAINLSGVAEARSVSMRNGAIVLGGGNGGSVRISGQVRATAPRQPVTNTVLSSSERPPRRGGLIQITGADIALRGALVDASGEGGGGRVRIGGDFGGKGPVPRATTFGADTASRIRADALTKGDGGRIVLWSDRQTGFHGKISARGGSDGGKGGLAEVSSAGKVRYTGLADLRAPRGAWGTMLLDPLNITISNDEGATVSASTVEANLATGNWTLDTSAPPYGGDGEAPGNINVNADLDWTAATTLTLQADNNISIGASVSAPNGGLNLQAAFGINVMGAAILANGLTMNARWIDISGGNVTQTGATGSVTADVFTMYGGTWTQNSPTLPDFNVRDFRLNSDFYTGTRFLRVRGGSGTAADPYLVGDAYGLQGMDSSATFGDTPFLNSHFALANNINASGTATWNGTEGGAEGFNPIGDAENAFTGSLDGRGYTISGLFTGSQRGDSGLFQSTSGATIRNLNLTGLRINANAMAGGVAASASNTVLDNVHASGAVTLSGFSTEYYAGGLVGNMSGGSITDSSAAVNVNVSVDGTDGFTFVNAGGLAGVIGFGSTVARAFSTGNVVVTSASIDPLFGSVGGFVGALSGTITDAFSSGNVRFTQNGASDEGQISVGGFAGYHDTSSGGDAAATMIRTAAHGNVNVTGAGLAVDVGGHTGSNYFGDIIDSYADGNVTSSSAGMQNVGGLIGYTGQGLVRNTYASGAVRASGAGSTLVGGLIGLNQPAGSGGASPTTVTASFYDRGRTGQAPNGLPGYGQAIDTATFRNTTAFFTLAQSQGWDFANVWAPGGNGAHPAIYTIDRVVFARPNNLTLRYGTTGAARATGNIHGGPSVYVFDRAGDTLATAPIFSRLTFPSVNVGTGQFALATRSLTSAQGDGYRVVSLPANYRITPAPLTIRADDQTKREGNGFVFDGTEFTASGLMAWDRIDRVSLSSNGAAANASIAGSPYRIVAANAAGQGLANYAITYLPGAMTLTAAPAPVPGITDNLPRPTPTQTSDLPNPVDTMTLDIGTGEAASSASTGVSRVILAARDAAGATLAQVDQFAAVLEIAAESCSQNDTDVSRYLACLSDALDDFANKLDEISTDLPPGMENVAEIVRDARRSIDSARTRAEQRLASATTAAEREAIRRDAIDEARGAIATASTEIRKAITLVRAEDPELARVHTATITRVAQAVDSVGIELSRAVGL